MLPPLARILPDTKCQLCCSPYDQLDPIAGIRHFFTNSIKYIETTNARYYLCDYCYVMAGGYNLIEEYIWNNKVQEWVPALPPHPCEILGDQEWYCTFKYGKDTYKGVGVINETELSLLNQSKIFHMRFRSALFEPNYLSLKDLHYLTSKPNRYDVVIENETDRYDAQLELIQKTFSQDMSKVTGGVFKPYRLTLLEKS